MRKIKYEMCLYVKKQGVLRYNVIYTLHFKIVRGIFRRRRGV